MLWKAGDCSAGERLKGLPPLATVATLMAVGLTGSTIALRAEKHQQVEKLVMSTVLHGSESLCKLLCYLAEQDELHPGMPVNEHELAAEVFGRPSGFDPGTDSTVRVQTSRLRTKLAEYYAGEGAKDLVIVEVPKGSCQLVFYARPVADASSVIEPGPALSVAAAARPRRRDLWLAFLTILATIGVMTAAVLGYLLAMQKAS